MNPADADDLPDEAELSGPLRDAIEQVRREEPSDAMLARVLERARQIAGFTACRRFAIALRSTTILPRGEIACLSSHFAVLPQPPPQRP